MSGGESDVDLAVTGVEEALAQLEALSIGKVSTKCDPPEDGSHFSRSFEEYVSWNAISASAIDWGLVSMEHMRGFLDGKLSKESRDLDLGRAIHCMLLEPEDFSSRFTMSGRCEAVLKSGKNKGQQCANNGVSCSSGQWWCGTHEPEVCDPASKHILTVQEMNAVKAIAIKIKSHPVVKMLRSHGGCETSLVWRWNGLRCKSRFDKLIHSHAEGKFPRTIIDVKKVGGGRISIDSVQKSIADYNYDMKAAFYCAASEHVYAEPTSFIWVFVEDSYPYGVQVLLSDEETLEIGKGKYEKVLTNYLTCLETQKWPGVSWDYGQGKDVIRVGGLPEWAKRKERKGE